MATFDYDGSGTKHELTARLSTLVAYEQEFKGDLVHDLQPRDDGTVNYMAYFRGLWAMLRAADGSVPPYAEWVRKVGHVDFNEVVAVVSREANEGFFRAGPASD
jgi:hypothetical protein